MIGIAWLADAFHDVAFAARLLRRNPLFTATATLSLAIGIGANTAVFMVIDALLLRPPAGVHDPARLVEIRSSQSGFGLNPVSYPVYLDVRRGTTTLDGVYASPMGTQALRLGDGDSDAGRVFGRYVTTTYFSTLGARPAIGRLFDGGDSDEPNASPIVVLSHRLWTQRFNQDAAIVGNPIRLNGRVFTVVGVAAPGFQGTGIQRTDLWVPLAMVPEAREVLANRDAGWLVIGGRLRNGATSSAAAAEVGSIDPSGLRSANPAERRQLRLVPMAPVQGGDALPTFLRLLLALVGAVLAIACMNVTGVLVARAAARQREIAVRVAIGGTRGRLIRQFIAETVLLFACGGLAGVLLAHNLTSVLVSLLPALPFSLDISLSVEGPTLLYTVGVALSVALLSGLAPGLYATKPNIGLMLGATAAASMRVRLRRALVVAQVSLSILLVTVAGLFARSLHETGAVNPGFDPRGVELVTLDMSSDGRVDDTELLQIRDVLDRIRQLPAVESATLALAAPGGFEGVGIGGIGRRDVSAAMLDDGDLNAVESGYFATMRIPLIAGRDFTAADRRGSQSVVILGQGTAARLWPGKSAREVIGETVTHYPFGTATAPSQAVTMQIVGIASDLKYRSLIDGAADVQVYVPYEQQSLRRLIIAVRTRGATNVNGDIRAILAVIAPTFLIASEQSAEDYAALGLVAQRVAAYVGGSLGLFGLLLAAIGLYGVTSYAVHHRTREIGIRVALGAGRRNVMMMIGREGMWLAVVGSVVGLLMAAAIGRAIATALIGVSPTDVTTFVSVGLLFGLATFLACCAPAYRATRIPPTEALRAE